MSDQGPAQLAWRARLELIRPANMVTAAADILAGFALAGALSPSEFSLSHVALVASSLAMYAGGITFNDVCDAELDRKERPERAIPRGHISVAAAARFASLLIIAALLLAKFASPVSLGVALGVAACALVYNRYTKHHRVLGPLTMGLCRAGNLLLGVSISTPALESIWPVGCLPLIFIAAVTLTSQGEVHANNRGSIVLAFALDLVLFVGVIGLGQLEGLVFNPLTALPFIGLWLFTNLRAKYRAITDHRPEQVEAAVRTGILSLIPLDAAYVAGSSGIVAGLLVLSLFPLSRALGKRFRVS